MMATLGSAGRLDRVQSFLSELIWINAARSKSNQRNPLAIDPEVVELIGWRGFVHAHLPWSKSLTGTKSDFVFLFAHSRFLAWASDRLALVPGPNLSSGQSGKAAIVSCGRRTHVSARDILLHVQLMLPKCLFLLESDSTAAIALAARPTHALPLFP